MQVQQRRGGLIETSHPVYAAAVQVTSATERSVVFSHEGHRRTFWRSAAKPWQLLAVLEAIEGAGHSENTPFTVRSLSDEDLAIGASSHSGGAEHTTRVTELLTRAGFGPEHLQCGAEAPLDPTELSRLQRDGLPTSPLHNDCSGKHALMLWACVARGWPLPSYLSPEHPLQERVAQVVSRATGVQAPTATDGCGVPTFHLSLVEMARAWADLAATIHDPDRDPLLARIGEAMMAHPELTSGVGRIDLALHERAQVPYVGKIGAEGVFCVALPGSQLGVAIKVASGNEAALAVAVPSVVDSLQKGVFSDTPDWPWARLHNVAGRVVGDRVLTFLPSTA